MDKSWINENDKLPDVDSGKYKVKRKDGTEMDAFYYSDKITWIAFYGLKTSYWWNSKYPHDRLDDITHWKDKK